VEFRFVIWGRGGPQLAWRNAVRPGDLVIVRAIGGADRPNKGNGASFIAVFLGYRARMGSGGAYRLLGPAGGLELSAALWRCVPIPEAA
jgi:hypothetical protein